MKRQSNSNDEDNDNDNSVGIDTETEQTFMTNTLGKVLPQSQDYIQTGQKRNRALRAQITVLCIAEDCDEKFCSKSSMIHHFQVAHCEDANIQGAGVKKCPLCSYATKKIFNLARHLNFRHAPPSKKTEASREKGNFLCDFCGSTFTNKKNQKRHIKNVHQRQLDYICDVCAKFFRDACTLQRHRVNCENRKCQYCGECLTMRQNVQRHMLKCNMNPDAHNRTPKRYKCSYFNCSKVFSLRRSLTEHYKSVHEKQVFQCQSCGQTFNWKSSFSRHKCKSLPLATVKCLAENCERKYRSKTLMMAHYRALHMDPKYSCQACGKMFAWLNTLKNHQHKGCSGTKLNVAQLYQGVEFSCAIAGYTTSTLSIEAVPAVQLLNLQ